MFDWVFDWVFDWLSDWDMAMFLESNMFADICAEGMIGPHLAGAFVVMENPWSSAIWRYRPIAYALICIGATDVRTDFCGWGEKWNKPTRLSGTLPGLESVRRVCRGRVGRCSDLRGRAPDGRWWTKVAQPYPDGLCVAVAHLVAAQQPL